MYVNYKTSYKYQVLRSETTQRKRRFQNESLQKKLNSQAFMNYKKYKQESGRNKQDYVLCSNDLNGSQKAVKLKREYPYQVKDLDMKPLEFNTAKFKYEEAQNIHIQPYNKCFVQHRKVESTEQPYKVSQNKWGCIKSSSPLRLKAGKKEALSIIIDSKVSKFQAELDQNEETFKDRYQNSIQRHLFMFQKKATQIDYQIQAGLSNIQKLIKEAKTKKQEKNQSTYHNSSKSDFSENNTKISVYQRQEAKDQGINLQKTKKADQNQSLPQGDSQANSQLFPLEYKNFINSLSLQIEKDTQFTNKIQDLTRNNQINEVKTLISDQVSKYISGKIEIDQSFFILQSLEIDPLEQLSNPASKKCSQQEINNIAINTYKSYKEIQTHFCTKLSNEFQRGTIELLFKELARFNSTKPSEQNSKETTIGHLLSYLNMKTNKSFRNRSFVKMAKRLSLKHYESLPFQAFQAFLKPQ